MTTDLDPSPQPLSWAEETRRMLDPNDPTYDADFATSYNEARAKLDRSYPALCAWGECTYYVDPLTGIAEEAFGLLGCGCDVFPGNRSRHLDGRAKPAVPVKATGRHGSRVTRSRRRHVRPDWLKRIDAIVEGQ